MRGLVAYYNGLFPESAEIFVNALIEDPEFAEPRFWLANAFMKMDRHGEAYTQFRKVKTLGNAGVCAASAGEQMIACLARLCDDEAKMLAISEIGPKNP